MSAALHSKIAEALARLSTLARHHENQKAVAEGLSPLQARALLALQRQRGIRVGELAKELLVTYGTLSAAVSSLEEKGLVVKHADPQEHRAVNLVLSRKGGAAARRIQGWATELYAAPIQELELDQAAPLLSALLELIRTFERRGTLAESRMCLTCRHFAPDEGQGERPHFCRLLGEPIGAIDLRIDCAEHERATAPAPR